MGLGVCIVASVFFVNGCVVVALAVFGVDCVVGIEVLVIISFGKFVWIGGEITCGCVFCD